MRCSAAVASREISARTRSGQRSEHALAATLATAWTISAAVTIASSVSMSPDGMPMPGGWTMSMAWMRMPGQTWVGATTSFAGMWSVMMAAMMLPSLTHVLRRHRAALDTAGEAHLAGRTAFVAAGYFFVWTAVGCAVFPAGAALAWVEMREPMLARAVPMTAGVVVVAAAAYQFTARKARAVACCRVGSARYAGAGDGPFEAWRHGLRLGFDCACCCGNLMTIVLALGLMDLRVMAVVTAAVTGERVAPAGERVARASGFVLAASGMLIVARAAWIR